MEKGTHIPPVPDTLEYAFGDIVYLVTDVDGYVGTGQVIGFLYKPGNILVQVQWGVERNGYYNHFELTKDRPKQFVS